MANPENPPLEEARKRARRRLVGAVVLALAAAVVLPMFLETDPAPLGPDVQIRIPAIDDGKFMNRLTPPVAPTASGSEKAASAAGGGTSATVAMSSAPSNGDAAAGKISSSTAEPAVARGSGETNAASVPSPAAAPEPAATPAGKSAPPAARPAAVSSTAPAPAAASPVAAAKQTAGPTIARVAAPAPAAALPAFSLTATVPVPGAAPAADPAKAPTATAQGGFVVQLGAFMGMDVAQELAAKAKAQGFPVFLEPVTTKSGPVQRVRVGPYATRGEADAVAGKLKAAGFTAVARAK